jgi:hypothetical protein
VSNADNAIKAATSVARDIAEGRLDPAALEAQAAEECRQLFGTVVGRDDPLWGLHVDIARQVLAGGGIPAGELQEWAAVARSREHVDERPAEGGDTPQAAPSLDAEIREATEQVRRQ